MCDGAGGGCGGACRTSGDLATSPRAPPENGPNDADSGVLLPVLDAPLPPGPLPPILRGLSPPFGCFPKPVIL